MPPANTETGVCVNGAVNRLYEGQLEWAWILQYHRFKLHAPNHTVVEAAVKEGKVAQLNVSPSAREKDVVLTTR